MTTGLAGESTLMKELIRAVVKDPAVAREVVGATLVDQRANTALKTLDELGMAPDDQVDPVAPTGVTVIGGARALFVRWDKAPASDRVERTIVRVQPPAPGTAREVTVSHDDGAARVPELFYNDPAGNTVTPATYAVTVRHVDRYGRSSPVFGPVTARPDPTFADSLKADTAIVGKVEVLVSVISQGRIAAGGASMGPTGLDLTETADDLSAPDVARGSKITPGGALPFAHFHYYNIGPPDLQRRGASIRADGRADPNNQGQDRRGQVRFDATGNGAVGGTAHALLLLNGDPNNRAGETYVRVSPRLNVAGPMSVLGFLDSNAGASFGASVRALDALVVGPDGGPFAAELRRTGASSIEELRIGRSFTPPYVSSGRSIGAGNTSGFSHGLGRLPNHVLAMYLAEPGVWRPTGEVDFVTVAQVTDTSVLVLNKGANAQTVRVSAF